MFCVAYLQLVLQDTVEPSRVRQLKQFSQWVQRLSSGLVQEAPAETEITPPSTEASLRGYGDATSLRQWVPAPGCHDYLAQLQTEPGLWCLPHAAQQCGLSCSKNILEPLSACKLKLDG